MMSSYLENLGDPLGSLDDLQHSPLVHDNCEAIGTCLSNVLTSKDVPDGVDFKQYLLEPKLID